MSVLVELDDGTSWEHEDATSVSELDGVLRLWSPQPGAGTAGAVTAIYAPGAWRYVEVSP